MPTGAARASTGDAHALTRGPMHATVAPSDASVLAQGRAGSLQKEGGEARRAGGAAELLPAESKRPRAGEARPGREASAGGAPTVTVKRLEVRLVEQAPPAPPADTRPAPAPAPQRDGWESLDRGHMGRHFLL